MPESLLHSQGIPLSLASSISPFYSSSPFLLSCDSQPSFKHPISLVLLLLLSLGLHLLYRGFIVLSLAVLSIVPPFFFFFPHSLDFFLLRHIFFFCFREFSFPFSSSLYLSGLPSSLAVSAPCLSALSFSLFCLLLGVSTGNKLKSYGQARGSVHCEGQIESYK